MVSLSTWCVAFIVISATRWQQTEGLRFTPHATSTKLCRQGLRSPAGSGAEAREALPCTGSVFSLTTRRSRSVCRMTADSAQQLGQSSDDSNLLEELLTLQHLTQNTVASSTGEYAAATTISPTADVDADTDGEADEDGGINIDENGDEDVDALIDDKVSSHQGDLPAEGTKEKGKARKKKAESSSTTSKRFKKRDISTVVSTEDNKAPIDWVLSRRLPENSRRFYRKALEAGNVKVDGRIVKRFVRVRSGSNISVDIQSSSVAEAAPRMSLKPENMPELRVLFEDEHFFAIMKPAGMVCQPCAAARKGTVLHGLLHHLLQTGQVEEGDPAAVSRLSQGIVQRLDKDTSGVMIVAKTLKASSKFSKLFKKARVRKKYLAICHNDPGFKILVDVPLYRRSSGKVGAVEKCQAKEFGAKDAQTRVQNVATAAGVSLCRAEIITGRMHQVRVHLKWLNCPIVGDKEYGDSEANWRVAQRSANRVNADGPLLHSVSIAFNHPFTNEHLTFRAPMPDKMWKTADNILRASGTMEQRDEFARLQALHELPLAEETGAVGGRGAPRGKTRREEKGGRGGRGGRGAREAYNAVVAAETIVAGGVAE